MPPLLADLARHTGARFELIPTENSLFGPTTTTAGLLVGADVRRALAGRADLDLALIPAESINQDGLFLDDESFVAVREALPMPVYPSYDFIDVLSLEGEPALPVAA
jgi:NifB/MoaA-like Fe-S oxidoreductase